jgi:hypothetical protein
MRPNTTTNSYSMKTHLLFAAPGAVPLVSTEILALDTDRRSHLSVGRSARSVFLDPDTGIRLHRRERHRSTGFVFADELVAIAADRPNGLALVFDPSVPRGSERKSVETKLQLLGGQGLAGFGDVSQVCFLVLGVSSELVREAHACVIAASDLPRRG